MQYTVMPEERKEICRFSDLMPGDIFMRVESVKHGNLELYMKMCKDNRNYTPRDEDYNAAVNMTHGILSWIDDGDEVMRYTGGQFVFSMEDFTQSRPSKDALYSTQ